MRPRFRNGIVALVAVPLVMLTSTPAGAAQANAMLVTGSGTISPGLTVIPTGQSLSFTGTATMVGTYGLAARYSCSWSGSATGSLAAMTGTISGNCGPVTFHVCVFVSLAPRVKIACPQSSPSGFTAFDCTFTPVDVNPTTKYNLMCEGAHVST